LKFCDAKFKLFHDVAYESSAVMAAERGAFPAWLHSIDPVRRRNIALLTIPPSGSISILAGVSSGIEPVFNLEYTRRRKVEVSDNIVFVDKQGDKWEEYSVFHPGATRWFESSTGRIYTDDLKDRLYMKSTANPYILCTANMINPFARVQLQAIIQKHIDHSISSTINLPKETTEQQIADIYMLAWKTGCKGITIYREGCRDGVLINKPEVKEEFVQHSAPKRPKELDCDIKTVKIKGDTHCILIGKYEDKPYEVFVYNGQLTYLPQKSHAILKIDSGKYMLIQKDAPTLRADSMGYYKLGEIVEKLTDEQKAITRLVSTALRHGTEIKFIVEQLNKTQGDLTSFNQAIARVLKGYMKDGDMIKGQVCDVCGNGMVMENGCLICKSCGNTKCG
jgi:ribonucleoside-diphosphate reductase alpha chain